MHKAWSSIGEVPYCFSRSSSNFKVTQLKKSFNLTQIGRFRTVTPVWIHWWIWNDTQSLMLYRRRALLFFGVIHQISRSHGWKIDKTVTPVWIHWWKWNDTQSLMLYRRLAILFFGVIHQISRSHRRKIDDLNPIWIRLLGRSELSNPSDLPCFINPWDIVKFNAV